MAARYYVLLPVLCLVAGCRPRETTTAASQPNPAEVVVSQDSPQEATSSLMDLLRAHLVAQGRHDYALANRYRDLIVRDLVAREDVMGRFSRLSGQTAHGEAEVLPRLVESWAAALAYYAKGIDLAHMRVSAVPSDEGKMIVEVPAHGGGEEAWLEVACLRGADGKWRIVGIDFALPAPAHPTTRAVPTVPASQTTSTSAP